MATIFDYTTLTMLLLLLMMMMMMMTPPRLASYPFVVSVSGIT